MNTTQVTTKTVAKKIAAKKVISKPETFRSYLYTGKTNKNWIAKNSKAFGSESKFLDALITAARKNKLEVKAPAIKKIVAKKAFKKTMKKTRKLQ